MNISFEIEKFKNEPLALISILSWLKQTGCYSPFKNLEIEAITCRTPSAAVKYASFVGGGICPESEKVFLKNPKLGVKYLRRIHRMEMQDPQIQKRFWKKVLRDPRLLLEWTRYTGQRVSEEEEEVFVQSIPCAKEYAQRVIKGKFPERIHQMLVLKSFEHLNVYQKQCLAEYLRISEGK